MLLPCSWMNHIEQWCGIFQRKRLRIADFPSKDHLPAKIGQFVCEWNQQAYPFNWFSKSVTNAMADALAIDPPAGFEAFSTVIVERCAITIVYEQGEKRPTARMIMPRLVLKVDGVAYVLARCQLRSAERTFRLDRIRECWLV
jgi:hypothetical protein